MDDLYNNAWGESVQLDDQDPSRSHTLTTTAHTADSSTSASSNPFSSFNLKPSWPQSAPSPIGTGNTVEDDEADLAAPSWSTGAGIRWNEPSEDSHGFGWSHTEPDMAWGASTYDSIQIGKPSSPQMSQLEPVTTQVEPITLSPPSTTILTASEPEEESPQQETSAYSSVYHTPEEAEPDTPSSPVEERSVSPEPEPEPQSPLRTPVPISFPSRSPSPDGFGGFSSGFEASDSSGFKASVPEDVGGDAWGSAWAGPSWSSSSYA